VNANATGVTIGLLRRMAEVALPAMAKPLHIRHRHHRRQAVHMAILAMHPCRKLVDTEAAVAMVVPTVGVAAEEMERCILRVHMISRHTLAEDTAVEGAHLRPRNIPVLDMGVTEVQQVQAMVVAVPIPLRALTVEALMAVGEGACWTALAGPVLLQHCLVPFTAMKIVANGYVRVLAVMGKIANTYMRCAHNLGAHFIFGHVSSTCTYVQLSLQESKLNGLWSGCTKNCVMLAIN